MKWWDEAFGADLPWGAWCWYAALITSAPVVPFIPSARRAAQRWCEEFMA